MDSLTQQRAGKWIIFPLNCRPSEPHQSEHFFTEFQRGMIESILHCRESNLLLSHEFFQRKYVKELLRFSASASTLGKSSIDKWIDLNIQDIRDHNVGVIIDIHPKQRLVRNLRLPKSMQFDSPSLLLRVSAQSLLDSRRFIKNLRLSIDLIKKPSEFLKLRRDVQGISALAFGISGSKFESWQWYGGL
ncbi:hypothetical protein CEXT_779441 [Caerostris extrusa]|uniref:Maturase K n=1 Tax=Caerostris extrusa TaxID=172846 RepID=A0AAV4XZH2_CAEEX|nr:hypothetical protein CEXT_779441 [Caerostris extrusa]